MIVRRGGKFSPISLGMLLPIAAALLSTVAVAQKSNGNPAAQQPQQAKSWQFEVAAIKPGDPKLGVGSWSSTKGGLFQMVNMPLKQWVEMGLSVRDYALKAPSWLDTSKFDLNARLPASEPVIQKATANQDPKAEMMKALLIERFGLKWHEELQTVSGYELVSDKKVLAKPATMLERLEGSHGSSSGPTMVQGTNMPMSEFAGLLAKVLGRPVVDATHLSGGFDFKLMWRPDNDATVAEWRRSGKQYGIDVDNLPDSVFTAVREQLGLRLQSAKVPSNVIVVDNINRQPTAN
jgi:uncharacterized protein (TIGR03435 family)